MRDARSRREPSTLIDCEGTVSAGAVPQVHHHNDDQPIVEVTSAGRFGLTFAKRGNHWCKICRAIVEPKESNNAISETLLSE
jgi:hypothetical protein